jgi:aminoglycoside phosphotransferase (APT) family kinase protein
VNIETYMAALDGVHDVPAAEIVPASEVAEGKTAAQAAASEQTAWWVLAEQIASSPATVAVIERASGLDRVGARLARIHDHLINAPLPSIAPRLDFVHGDAGRANYVVDRAGTVWLIDWELAHAGSRLEDYAWIELRGLEQDEHAWRREVIARLVQLGPTSAEAYRYFRTAIYFRSVVAISARIAAEPRHSFVPYLTHRFRENEQLGWMSAGVATPNASSTGPRFDAWRRWTHSLESMTGAS